ncbi:MAG TPA: PAS domain-containing protein [Candidatus Didemnitutus sp.]|nr:PAS domain-containing protein [Candidatus Didemnitutus sp.]
MPAPEQSPKSPLRILHLEDNLHDRVLILEALRTARYACEFLWVDNQSEYESALRDGEYDLILSDYSLPSYDGGQALGAARRAQPATPFIFVSGTIGEERAVESLKCGATDYVLKHHLERLIPAVQRALRESQERHRRRETEQALARSEERFRELAANIRDVFWTTEADGRTLLYVNPAFEHVWHRSPVEALTRPTSWIDAIVPEDRPLFEEATRQIAEGTSYCIAFRLTWPDGTLRWVESRAYPVQDLVRLRVERVVGVTIDITDAKAAEHRLRSERHLLRTILDHLPDYIYARDRQSRHVLNNRANLDAMGVAHDEETTGRTDFDFYPAELARAYQEDNERVFRSGVPLLNREEPGIGPNGEPRLQLTTKVPLRDPAGNVVGLVGIGRDVTDLRRAAEQIEAQARMLDQANDAIITTDQDDRIIYWNAGAERALGWPRQEMVGKRVHELVSSECVAALDTARNATSARGEWLGELKVRHRDGRTILLEVHRSLLRTPAGEVTGHLNIGNDVTDRRKFEAQMLRAQRMESIGTLASGIAHDLNNVLAPILMSIALLRIKVPGKPEVASMLDQLETNVQRGAHLVQQVLAFGRGVETDRLPVQIKHVAHEIEQIVHDTFPKNIEFDFTFEPEVWTVTGDPTQVHQVLLNLCVNARDAMPSGGRLELHLENAVIDRNFFGPKGQGAPGPYVVVSVTDTGTGIPAAIRDRIFDPFFTTKDVGKGTGLGLSTSLAIIKSHGGFIRLHTEERQGTTFKVYLPGNPSASAPAEPEAPRMYHGNNELVLVVDDELAIRELTKLTLERFGYRVLVAANGTQAVAHYALHPQDVAVVITDMTMPIMDGPATILALRSINPDVKVIGCSGQSAEICRNSAKAVGVTVDNFISKPFKADMLLRAVHRVLGKKTRNPWKR